MVSRAVGAAALFVLAASTAFAQSPEAMPAPGCAPGEGVPTSVEPMLGSGPSVLSEYTGNRFWFSGGYQAGFIRNQPTPATIATQGGAFAIQGSPGVSRVLGGGDTDVGTLHGGRFNGGFWLGANRAFGIEAGVFFLAEKSANSSVSGGNAALGRPFYDTSIQAQNVRLLNLPGQVTGGVTNSVSSLVVGTDLGPIVRVIETDMLTLDQLFYFRYFTLEEAQNVTDSVSPTGGVVTFRGQPFRGTGTSVSVRDSALAINHFYGGGAGLRLGITPGRFSLSMTGRIAVGKNSGSLRLDGATALNGTGADQTATGGLLVPANAIGRYNRSDFSYMPEVGIKVGFQITRTVGVYAGYNFLYMTNVVRPGESFSTQVNPTQLPSSQNFGVPFGPNNSAVQLSNSDFWMHTVGVGVNLNF